MTVQIDPCKCLKRGFFQRLLGKCQTVEPEDAGCWSFENGEITVDLNRAPELTRPNGALRLERKDVNPLRILIIRGDDDKYYSFSNRCAHFGRRLDPVPGAGTVQCCSGGKSTYDYTGERLKGPAKGDIKTYKVVESDGKLVVKVEEAMRQ